MYLQLIWVPGKNRTRQTITYLGRTVPDVRPLFKAFLLPVYPLFPLINISVYLEKNAQIFTEKDFLSILHAITLSENHATGPL